MFNHTNDSNENLEQKKHGDRAENKIERPQEVKSFQSGKFNCES